MVAAGAQPLDRRDLGAVEPLHAHAAGADGLPSQMDRAGAAEALAAAVLAARQAQEIAQVPQQGKVAFTLVGLLLPVDRQCDHCRRSLCAGLFRLAKFQGHPVGLADRFHFRPELRVLAAGGQ